MNRTLRSLLKTAVYGMYELLNRVDRASDVLSHVSDRGRKMVYREEKHTGAPLELLQADGVCTVNHP